MNGTNTSQTAHSRRRFLQWSGTAAAASLAGATTGLARNGGGHRRAKKPAKAVKLGVASYTFRKFDLDTTLALTRRAGLKYVCLKSMHLPLEAKPERIAEAVKKVRAAGLTLYGCGVVYMNQGEAGTAGLRLCQGGRHDSDRGLAVARHAGLLDEKVQRVRYFRSPFTTTGRTTRFGPRPRAPYEKIKDFDPRLGLCIDIGHTVRAGPTW